METSIGETLSTLKFAQRAKLIRTIPVQNVEVVGNMEALQAEVLALRARLASFENTQIPSSLVNADLAQIFSPHSKTKNTSIQSTPVKSSHSAVTPLSPLRQTMHDRSGGFVDVKTLANAMQRCQAADGICKESEQKVL